MVHPALIPTERIIQAHDGGLTLSEWFGGELLHSPRERRADPDEPFRKFQRLSASEIAAAMDSSSTGMSGSTRSVIDFEFYHRGPYRNEVGRLPGSTGFMAPEEFTKGAVIDARTRVFAPARMIEIFLMHQNVDHPSSARARAATRVDPNERPAPPVGVPTHVALRRNIGELSPTGASVLVPGPLMARSVRMSKCRLWRRRLAYGLLMFDVGALELLIFVAFVAALGWLLMRRRGR